MKIQIKSIPGSVLFEGDFSCLADAVQAAVESSADLSSADLRSANLSYANLSSDNLRYADLSYANLRYANLSSANLRSANLRSADLSSANLSYANLSSANLSYANLSSADLSYAKDVALVIARTRIIPAEGDFIGWKKCTAGVIAKLLIPDGAKRSHAFGRKCRAEFVQVLELSGDGKQAASLYSASTIYEVGQVVRCDKWEPDFTIECGGGIHFYLTREEAEAHQ